jgi:hypothetical protein
MNNNCRFIPPEFFVILSANKKHSENHGKHAWQKDISDSMENRCRICRTVLLFRGFFSFRSGSRDSIDAHPLC